MFLNLNFVSSITKRLFWPNDPKWILHFLYFINKYNFSENFHTQSCCCVVSTLKYQLLSIHWKNIWLLKVSNIYWGLIQFLLCNSLWRRHGQTIWNCASLHKIDYHAMVADILNFEGHQHCIIGSNVTAIFLNRWILPIGGVTSGRVCAQSVIDTGFTLCPG